jgi:hypothetical protein
MKRQKDAPRDETDGANQQAAPESNTETPAEQPQRKPSWRDFYAIHPAAEFFHQNSSDEQLQKLADDINRAQRIFDPIHTATVFGKTFVIDGVSRLDALEKTSRQIVDEKSNWIGAVKDHVIHHAGKTDEDVWDIVTSLNFTRRHLTDDQRAAIGSKIFGPQYEAEAKARKKATQFGAESTVKAKSPSPQSPKDESIEFGATTPDKVAARVKVSQHKARKAERLRKDAPEELDKVASGEKPLRDVKATPKRKSKKSPQDVPFEDQAYKKWTTWLANNFTPQQRTEMMPRLVEWIDWLNRVPDPLGFIQKWMQWLRRFPHAQRSKVMQLVSDWIGHDQKEGNDRE